MNRHVSAVGLLLCFSVPAMAARSQRGSSSEDSGDEVGHFSVAPLVGYGVGLESRGLPLANGGSLDYPKPYGFGFGVRGGYAFPFHLYTGLNFTYLLGTSQDYDASINGIRGTLSLHTKMFTVTAEAGYQFEWDAVRLRPYVGLGIADASVSVSFRGQDLPQAGDSSAYLAVQPGAAFEFSFTGSAPGPFIGVDTHLSLTTGSGTQGLVFLATGGYRF